MDEITVTKFIAIPGAFVMFGYSFASSQNFLPLIFNQPAKIATPVFSGVFHRGGTFMVPMTSVTAAAFAYLAYRRPAQRSLYATASALVFGFLPWTMTVMYPGIQRLLEIGKSSEVQMNAADASGETLRLLKAWHDQNLVRASMAFAGGMTGLFAALGV
ncbi:hypothetical protein MBLNU457_4197t1 [Dothideomycetes sp. NU457]